MTEATPGSHPNVESADPEEQEESAGRASKSARRAWARLLRRIYEVDPLTCPKCRVQMQIVAVVTAPAVVDRILRHRAKRQLVSPFASRAPPAA